MSNEYSTVQFLGTSDEVLECECCGRKNLKSTVAISFDGGDAVYFGVVCAAKALKVDAKFVKSAAKGADDAKRKAEHDAKMAEENAKRDRWFAWLEQNGTGSEPFARIQSLGGYPKANAAYKASQG